MKQVISMILIFQTILLSGCNTVNGLGQDIQAGGKAISGSSK